MLTRFEKARVVGARALQLAMGAPILVKMRSVDNILEIVTQELEDGVLPFTVIREGPDGSDIFLNVKGEKIGETKKQDSA